MLNPTIPQRFPAFSLTCLALALFIALNQAHGQDSADLELARMALSNYCYDCHTGDEPEGGIGVEFLDGDESLEKHVEVVEKMIRVLKESQMPPADYDQPDSRERVALIEMLETRLGDFDCGEVSRPGRVTIRRLNRVEYDNSVRDLTGLDLRLAKDFPSDDVGNGFDNIGDVLTIPPILLEKYVKAATEIGEAVANDENAIRRVFPPRPEEPDEAYLEELRSSVSKFASKVYRRKITKPEESRLIQLIFSAFMQKGMSEKQTQALAVAALFSSPHFIYKVESDEPKDFVDGIRTLNDFELATRLSYFLWSSTPDNRLLDLAAEGKLHTPEQLSAEVDRMLDDEKSSALVSNFAGQWLQLRDLNNLSPDPELFTEFDDKLRSDMRRETELLFASLIENNESVLTLLNADYTFLNERLADFYGVENIAGDEFQRVSLNGLRSGVLMHASVLLITSNPTRTSPVKRGKWVLDNLLGEPPPPPPPDVPELEETGENLGTLRQQMEEHRANPNCAVCHTKMDALGFGLENFDAIGKWRQEEGGDPIDPSGELPGGRKFAGPVDLVKILAEDKQDEFARCMIQKMLTYSLGRGLGVYDRCTINTILAKLRGDDFKFRTLVKAIVTSEPFTMQEAP